MSEEHINNKVEEAIQLITAHFELIEKQNVLLERIANAVDPDGAAVPTTVTPITNAARETARN